MASAPYNKWYDATYGEIATMASWSQLDVDVAKKVVCVYAWMPQTIMGIKHTGGRPKWATFSLARVQKAFTKAATTFDQIKQLELRAADLDEIETSLLRVLKLLFLPLGSVAASKYLHFSAPKLVPMWDRKIRLAQRHSDTPQGFISYMRQFKAELAVPRNLRAATRAYPANPIRGWDMVNMKRRDA
jgi:hypothetical protein